jgi:hypothetical protein
MKNRLKRILYRFRSAVTGRFVSEKTAAKAPKTTVRERRK